MFKNLAVDTKLHYCGCSAGAAGGDAACGPGGGGGGGDSSGPSAAQAAAANEPGGFAVTGENSFTTDAGTFSNSLSGGVSFDANYTSMDLGNPAAPSVSTSQQMAAGLTAAPAMTASSPAVNKYATSVPGRSKGFNKGYQSALATAKEQSKAAFANPTYNVQQEDMVRGMQPVASPANLLANVTKPATKTPTFFGRPTVNHKDVISQKEVQAELDRRAATVGPKGPTVSEINATKDGIPGDRPNAELSIIDRGMNIYKGVQNLKRDAVERVSKDIAGLGRALKGEPMEYLGEVAHPTVNIPGVTQSVYSNVPGAHIDSMGRYNTNPDMDYAPSSGQLSQPSDSGGSTTPLRAPSTVAPSTTSPYSAPGVADAPLHNTSAPTYTPRVVMVGGIPHYRDVSGRLVKFMGY